MALTVKRDLTLEKLFDDFAIDPDKKTEPTVEQKQQTTNGKNKQTEQKK